MAIDVAIDAVVDAWEGDVDLLELSLAGGQSASSVQELVRDAFELTNERFQAVWLNPFDGLATVGHTPVAAGSSLRWVVDSTWPQGYRHWIVDVIERLEARGIGGVLSTYDLPPDRPFNRDAHGRPVFGTTYVAGWTGGRAFGPGTTRKPWIVHPEGNSALARFSEEFLALDAGVTAMTYGPSFVVPPTERPRLLERGLNEDPRKSSAILLEAKQIGEVANRCVSYTSDGFATFSVATSLDRLPAARQEARVWAEQLAGWCDWVVEVESYGTGRDLAVLLRHRRPEWRSLRPGLGKHRVEDRERLPDAFAWQIVTTDHLRNMTDSSAWNVRSLTGGMAVLEDPRGNGWLPDNVDEHSWAGLPRALTRARREFGSLISPPIPEGLGGPGEAG